MQHKRLIFVLLAVLGYMALFYAAPLPTLEARLGQRFRRLDLVAASLVTLRERVAETAGPLVFADRLAPLAIAGAVLACAASLGWLLMSVCRADRGLTRPERLIFSTAVGLNALSTGMLLLGLVGGIGQRWLVGLAMLLILALAGWRALQRVPVAACLPLRNTRADKPPMPPDCSRDSPQLTTRPGLAPGEESPLASGWLWLAVPFVLILVLGALMPPIEFDVREYHLQAPKEFFQQGRIGFLPHNVYANMPLGSEMLSLLAMVLAGDWWLGALAGKTVLAAMTLLTACGLLAAGRRLFSPAAGVVAALVYLSTPWIFLVSTTGLVEGASACYLFLALYAILLWRVLPETVEGDSPIFAAKTASAVADIVPAAKIGTVPHVHPVRGQVHVFGPQPVGQIRPVAEKWTSPRWGRLLLAGYLAGSAVACKYPAVLFVVLPLTVGIAATAIGLPLRASGKTAGTFLSAVFVAAGLWFGKNWVLTGNPAYPLLYNVFDGKTRTPEKDRQWNRVHRPHDFSAGTLGKDLARVGCQSEWLSPLLAPLALLALAGARRRPGVIVPLAVYFASVIAAWWLLTHRIDRFWLPALPIVALLAGAGACWSSHRAWRAALPALLIVALGTGFLIDTAGVLGDCRWLAPLEQLRRDSGQVNPWHLYFNRYAGRSRVLLIGDAQPFDLEVPALYNTTFDDCLFQKMAEGRSPEEVRVALADAQIAYLYVDWAEIARYRRPGNYGFTKFIQPALFDNLVRAGVLAELPRLGEHPGRGYRVRM